MPHRPPQLLNVYGPPRHARNLSKTNHTQSLPNYPGQNIHLKARPTTPTLKSARSLPNPAPQKRLGRVEEGRVVCTALASLRFPSPLIKPDVRISRIRLSDWLHPEAHGGGPR